MRQNEVMNGVAVYDREGNKACTSKLAARTGISQVNMSGWKVAEMFCGERSNLIAEYGFILNIFRKYAPGTKKIATLSKCNQE
jgi:hypothetical protein